MNKAYRVWDGEQMHYWDDEGLSLEIKGNEWILWRDGCRVIVAASYEEETALMWGTGEKDKNSKEIYADDVAEGERYNYRRFNVLIKFGVYEQDASGGEYSGAECIGFYGEAINPKETDEIGCHVVSDYERQVSLLEFTEIKVLGDVYQNPELLEGVG
ncbi:YopX family protein [Bacillus atrophaeus]|uniref:YopX family protein n=1 Tax=Bacillus atrophaeus TaxID=1452 RepID=UPI0022818053|nr:YopX family protein [Bacillus atrophaeus]MCY8947997.1 YopX family protein [Bacillus atrophaeus]